MTTPAHTYVALLRGINVSGQKTIRMADLQTSLSCLGFQKVQTYLQSGNVVFRTGRIAEKKLAARIQKTIADEFGHDVPVLVLSAEQLNALTHANPLWTQGDDEALFHCTFLCQTVDGADFNALKMPTADGERAALVEGAILLHCPHGYGRTKLNNSYFERALKVQATTRNWRTVLALQAMCNAP